MRGELADEFPQQDIAAFAGDMAEREQRLELFDWIADRGSSLSLLVNNVGTNRPKPTLDYAEDDWRALFETNLFSAFEHNCGPIGPYCTSTSGLVFAAATASTAASWVEIGA